MTHFILGDLHKRPCPECCGNRVVWARPRADGTLYYYEHGGYTAHGEITTADVRVPCPVCNGHGVVYALPEKFSWGQKGANA